MGRVYLGRSPGGRQVAIKVIRPELAEDADFRARFGREISAARKVSGIFTASVVDADLDGPMPWLATSYIAGPSLADAVTARGPLPESIVLRLAAGLAEGLSAIHAAGVVHRDLKPSNVLLADDGPRLIDFGISRSMETSALTQTGTVVGSPGFMSPEQTQGREVGPPSDIFSLGAVLTFAATGEGPFGQGSTVALLYRVVTSQPNTAGLPGGLRLVAGCSESPSSGEATLQRAIDTRQDILNHLPALSVSGLPNGTQLVRTLTTTMQDSIAADKDYQGWMEDFANSGNPCGSDPSQDSNYAAAVNVSNAATIAKNAFVAIWDPMAPRYGQQVVSSTGF
jgi:serine/threonine protein kinase